MYEAMRQRAPHSSKLAGVSATAICLGLATWALLSGFGEQLVKVIQKRTTFVTVPPTPSEPVEPAEKKFEIDIDFPAPPIPPLPLEQLETFKPPIAQPTQTEGSTESTANIPPPLAPVRK